MADQKLRKQIHLTREMLDEKGRGGVQNRIVDLYVLQATLPCRPL